LKVDENEFEEDNSHNETTEKSVSLATISSEQYLLIVNFFTEKSVSLATISSEQYLLIVNFFMKYNKFGLTLNYRWRASIHSW
jgi:hypothetical protein